ncbi:Phosphatidylglycerophosphatase A [Candidatus Rhodobacter oscarellae]|uniref:Phosphatidylglycerophosphatase A n=1 Tax=Candidatus Rhodobacter oscarellae TaxID=1675527 RepID=A0A0J9E6A6_9RHOB|nr:phosphatidylglycerophosphatase A [Candidatus Rhodobacter lobularis]KMW57364.1 Phosphatidylglycerophosphatase A [Candidatus Rhodobacter lobularis]
MSRLIATFIGVGYLPWAPGTWGTAAAVPAAILLHWAGGITLLAAATLGVAILGWWATAEITRGQANHDPSEVVIDEVAGMWLTLWPVSLGAGHAGVEIWRLWPGLLAGFVLFRLFDILKPGPIGWADRMNTPLGVMLDDLLAGVAAAICVGGLAWLSHGALGL